MDERNTGAGSLRMGAMAGAGAGATTGCGAATGGATGTAAGTGVTTSVLGSGAKGWGVRTGAGSAGGGAADVARVVGGSRGGKSRGGTVGWPMPPDCLSVGLLGAGGKPSGLPQFGPLQSPAGWSNRLSVMMSL